MKQPYGVSYISPKGNLNIFCERWNDGSYIYPSGIIAKYSEYQDIYRKAFIYHENQRIIPEKHHTRVHYIQLKEDGGGETIAYDG